MDLRIDLTFLELWRLIDGLTQLFSQFPSEHFHFFLINLVLKRLELTLRQTNCQVGKLLCVEFCALSFKVVEIEFIQIERFQASLSFLELLEGIHKRV